MSQFIILIDTVYAAEHCGANDPFNEGWTTTPASGANIGSALISDPDYPEISSWELASVGGYIEYEAPGPSAGVDWEYTIKLRVVSLNDSMDSGSAFQVDNGTGRYALAFGSNANGDTLIKWVTDGVFTGTPSHIEPTSTSGQTEYVEVSLIYSASENSVDIFVNDVEVGSNYTGMISITRRVGFGDAGSAPVGNTRYALVSERKLLKTLADVDGDGIPGQIETFFGLNPNEVSDGCQDLDSDTWNNDEEYRAGSELNNAASNPSTLAYEQQKIFGPNIPSTDLVRFGQSVAIENNTAVIGAYVDNDGKGAAYIFEREAELWKLSGKLEAQDEDGGDSADFFGYSVDISGNTIVVGTPQDDENAGSAGAAYVFVRNGNTWNLSPVAKLKAFDSDGIYTGDKFGESVSIHGDTIVIGARFDDENGGNLAGAAYVFTRNGNQWNLTPDVKLVAVDQGGSYFNYQFGNSVSIYGNSIIVGAYFDQEDGVGNVGAAYVFNRINSVWNANPAAKLVPEKVDGQFVTSLFGESVAIKNNRLIVSARNDLEDGISNGAVFIYTNSGSNWTQQAKLNLNTSVGSPFEGVDIDGSTAIVSSYDDGDETAVVKLFTEAANVWTQRAKLVASDSDGMTSGDAFGRSVVLDGNMVLVGAPFDDDVGNNYGASYYYNIIDTDGDGLLDSIEALLGTLNDVSDTDMDGISDFDEVNFDNDPTNYLEFTDTNPNLPDTDGDGIDDGDEVSFDGDPSYNPLTDTDPNSEDSDGDNINDFDEINYDGIPDYNELTDLNPLKNDTDNDGWNDDIEIAQGTDPLDDTSFPQAAPATVNVPLPLWSLMLMALSICLVGVRLKRA